MKLVFTDNLARIKCVWSTLFPPLKMTNQNEALGFIVIIFFLQEHRVWQRPGPGPLMTWLTTLLLKLWQNMQPWTHLAWLHTQISLLLGSSCCLLVISVNLTDPYSTILLSWNSYTDLLCIFSDIGIWSEGVCSPECSFYCSECSCFGFYYHLRLHKGRHQQLAHQSGSHPECNSTNGVSNIHFILKGQSADFTKETKCIVAFFRSYRWGL